MKVLIIILVITTLLSNNLFAQTSKKFVFGINDNQPDVININDVISISKQKDYGFDFDNQESINITESFCTSEKPFYFSVKVPEGTYNVSIELGNPQNESTCFIKAEARRLMAYDLKIKKGETITINRTINVRSPQIDSTHSINLKEREMNHMNWDNRLTIEFSGYNVAVRSINIKPKEKYTTLFLAGNSTVTDQDCAPWASWGKRITNYLKTDISVANYAESGASLSSFKARGRLDKILSLMQPNDYIFIEFGHNDQKQKGEGIGAWLSFTDLLKEFISKSREKGGIPVLVTPTQRRSFNDEGIIQLTHDDYPDAMRKLAKDLNVPLIDLNKMTKIVYEAWGIEKSKNAFVHYPANTFPGQDKELADNTHFNTFGAHEVALCVLSGIKTLDIDLKNKITDFDSYNVEAPNKFENWLLPMSPRFVSTKPDGN